MPTRVAAGREKCVENPLALEGNNPAAEDYSGANLADPTQGKVRATVPVFGIQWPMDAPPERCQLTRRYGVDVSWGPDEHCRSGPNWTSSPIPELTVSKEIS